VDLGKYSLTTSEAEKRRLGEGLLSREGDGAYRTAEKRDLSRSTEKRPRVRGSGLLGREKKKERMIREGGGGGG